MIALRASSRLFLALGIALMITSAAMFMLFLQSLQSRSESLKGTTTRVAALRSEIAVQKSIAAFEQSAGREILASREEQMSAYVLPMNIPSQRMVRALEESVKAINDHAPNSAEKLKIENIASDAERDGPNGLRERPVNLILAGSATAAGKLLAVMDISGTPSVGQLLGTGAVARILKHAEALAPQQLPTVQSALSLDVLATFADQGGTFERLIVELPESVGEQLRVQLTDAGILGSKKTVEANLASALLASRAWPMPLMMVDSFEGSDGKWTVGMRIFSRSSSSH